MHEKVIHIGIAVKDIEKAVFNFSKLFGRDIIPLTEYRTSNLHYRIGLIQLGELALELIEPLTKAGMAEEHLKDFGPGVYHLAIAVNDLAEAITVYNKRGFETQEIRKGIHGERICFLKDPVLPGIYLELVESCND